MGLTKAPTAPCLSDEQRTGQLLILLITIVVPKSGVNLIAIRDSFLLAVSCSSQLTINVVSNILQGQQKERYCRSSSGLMLELVLLLKC